MTTNVDDSVDVSNNDKQYMLTTIDNPYNPFTQYDDWYALDAARGHHTPGLLARYVITSDDLSFLDQEISIQTAINEILRDDPLNIYRKVTNDDFNKN